MDALSDKGVSELVIFDLYGNAMATRFPLQRLKTGSLTLLALGFFHIAGEDLRDNSWCDVVSSLVTLSVTGCSFPVSALSTAVFRLGCLRTLTIASCNLSVAGLAATAIEKVGGLIIDSLSLYDLRLWKCASTKMLIEYTPLLGYLDIGITHLSGQQVSIMVREAFTLHELHAVSLHLHTIEIHGAKDPAFRRKKRESLPNLNTVSITLNFCLPGKAAALLDLLSLFPALTELTLSHTTTTQRVDDVPASGSDNLSVAEPWYLGPPVPKCLKSSLQKLVISDYRGGVAELALLKSLLGAAQSLVSLSVCPHAHNSIEGQSDDPGPSQGIEAVLYLDCIFC